MSFRDLRYQIIDRAIALFNDDRRFVKLFSRFGILVLFAGIVMVVAPTSATENSPDPSTELPVPIDTQTVVVDSITATPEPSPVMSQVDTSTIGETLTVVSNKETVTALSVQPKFSIKAPATLTIDPRATTKYLPQLSITGSEYVLACISGSNVNLDISAKRTLSDGVRSSKIVVGDLTPMLFVSGKTTDVESLINVEGGLLAYSTGGGLAERSINIELVAMSSPGVKRSFCDFAKSSTTIYFRSMGLEISTNKSGINLK